MSAWWSWIQAPPFWILVGFHLFIFLVMAVDLGVFHRRPRTIGLKEAALWSAVWTFIALIFAGLIWKFWHLWNPATPEAGPVKAGEFVTGYLVEQALSIDNLFVFLVIFRYFGVPEPLRHRVLLWGILGAIIMRATFILAGAGLLRLASWVIYLFAAALIWTAWKLTRNIEEEVDPSRNWVLRLARRLLPVVDHYQYPKFWVRHEGRWHATPLPLVLLVIETTDLVFAFDSIPATFGITRDPFIVYTSNIFAVIGLRSLYFLLAGFLGMFRYLNLGLALVLFFVGVKMILEEWLKPEETYGIDKKYLILGSLAVIVVILATAVLLSVLRGPKETPAS
jgi:tellurite resistance protein TerC